VFLVSWNGDAPLDAGTADGQILEAGFDEGDDFVAARLRPYEFWMGIVVFEQRALEGREFEEIVFLVDCLRDASAVRAGRTRRNIDERFVGDTVLAGVGALVDISAVLQQREELRDSALVARLGGADKVVVGEAHAVPQSAELRRDLIGKLLRAAIRLLGRALNLLPVLVGSGEEKSILAQAAFAPRDHIRNHRGIGCSDVRAGVDVVDRRGEIELI